MVHRFVGLVLLVLYKMGHLRACVGTGGAGQAELTPGRKENANAQVLEDGPKSNDLTAVGRTMADGI